MRIPRWLDFIHDAKYEVFGFCDTSQIAYAACIYLKTTKNNKSEICLLQAKSKVSPIKPMLTISKLELRSALLLSRLTIKVSRALDLPSGDTFLHGWFSYRIVPQKFIIKSLKPAGDMQGNHL